MNELLRELAYAKATFQLRTLELIVRGPAIAAAAEGRDAKQARGASPAERAEGIAQGDAR